LSCEVEAQVMPTYAYRCDGCGEAFERTESMTEHETAKPQCPKCGSQQVVQVPVRFFAKTAKKS
jgi:putative FmdB family regulatory protein